MFKLVKWVLIVAGVLFAVAMCGTVVTAAVMSVGADTELSAEQNDVIADSEAQAAPEAPEPEGFGPGTWEVGTDIKPGTYKTKGPAAGSPACYWERQKNLDGGFDSILDNENLTGPGVVRIKKSDAAFSTFGCGRFVLQK